MLEPGFCHFFLCREQGGSFLKFVMLLKWQSSIRVFSQIWLYSKYEHRKLLSTLSSCLHFQAVVRILHNQKKESQFFGVFFFQERRECVTEYSFSKIKFPKFSHKKKKITTRGRSLRGFWILVFSPCSNLFLKFPSQAVPYSIILYPLSCAQSYNCSSIYISSFPFVLSNFCVENVNISYYNQCHSLSCLRAAPSVHSM